MAIKVPEKVSIGSGTFKYQTYTAVAAKRFLAMQNWGGMRNAKIVLEREVKALEDDKPLREKVRRIIREKGYLEFESLENFNQQKKALLGCGTTSTTAAAPTESITEYKRFTELAFECLRAKKNTATSIVVTSVTYDETTDTFTDPATPVTYVEDKDYTMGILEGCDAIRRTDADSNIAVDTWVKITYTWANPGSTNFAFGGVSTVTEMLGELVIELADEKREFYRFKFVPPGISEDSFISEDFGKTTVRLAFLSDDTLSAGGQLYNRYQEN